MVLCTRSLEVICSVSESAKVKSGVWDDSGLFLYSTVNHLKYMLPNGERGIIKTLNSALYITRMHTNKVHFVDREAQCGSFAIDITECYFKMALHNQQWDVGE